MAFESAQERAAGGRMAGLRFRHPARVVVFAFACAVLVGAALLMLPVSRSGPGLRHHGRTRKLGAH